EVGREVADADQRLAGDVELGAVERQAQRLGRELGLLVTGRARPKMQRERVFASRFARRAPIGDRVVADDAIGKRRAARRRIEDARRIAERLLDVVARHQGRVDRLLQGPARAHASSSASKDMNWLIGPSSITVWMRKMRAPTIARWPAATSVRRRKVRRWRTPDSRRPGPNASSPPLRSPFPHTVAFASLLPPQP